MKQFGHLALALILLAAVILAALPTDAQCNVCNEHGIACVNETSFRICSGGQLISEKVFTCPSNKLCTTSASKCVEAEPNVKPTCEKTAGCGICNGNKIFACTSRTSFALCDGEKLTQDSSVCPDGLVCDSQSGDICKNECDKPAVLECDIEAST